VVHGLIGDATFRMAGIIAAEAVAAPTAGQGVEESLSLFEFVEAQIKQASPLPV
jgi:outer membrane lipoprotein SlyB